MDVINGKFAATNDPTKGPVFGLEDLTIGYDNHALGVPRLSRSVIGGAYSLPKEYNESDVNGFGLLAETTSFTWDDLEVFYYDSELQLSLSPTKIKKCPCHISTYVAKCHQIYNLIRQKDSMLCWFSIQKFT